MLSECPPTQGVDPYWGTYNFTDSVTSRLPQSFMATGGRLEIPLTLFPEFITGPMTALK